MLPLQQNQFTHHMNRLNSNILSIVITTLLAIVVVVSSLTTSNIVNTLKEEEQKKIELWAEATRQFILAGENKLACCLKKLNFHFTYFEESGFYFLVNYLFDRVAFTTS